MKTKPMIAFVDPLSWPGPNFEEESNSEIR